MATRHRVAIAALIVLGAIAALRPPAKEPDEPTHEVPDDDGRIFGKVIVLPDGAPFVGEVRFDLGAPFFGGTDSASSLRRSGQDAEGGPRVRRGRVRPLRRVPDDAPQAIHPSPTLSLAGGAEP